MKLKIDLKMGIDIHEFVFFDFEQGMLSVILEYAAMMGFWVFAGFSVTIGTGKFSAYAVQKKRDVN